MIFKQFFDSVSSTYTYLLASSQGSEALIIDPVLENVEEYLKFLGMNSLQLVVAMDTHIHADHKTALGKLRSLTRCMTCMSEKADIELISRRLTDGDKVSIAGITLEVLTTPGHTDDSCCFYIQGMVFTGDTLFIRGNGRTDFQHGDAGELYDSIEKKLFSLPDDTLVFPAHDYKGEQLSTIGREKLENPRYFGKTRNEFIEIMNTLDLPDPAQMDIVVPYNKGFSKHLGQSLCGSVVLNCEQFAQLSDHLIVDLRDQNEVDKYGSIANSILLPLRDLESAIDDKTHLINNATAVVFYCAHGERSVLGLELALDKGLTNVKHLSGGMQAWMDAGNAIV